MTSLDQAEIARALFEEIGDALFLLDPDTDRLIEVNPVAERLTGFTHAELLQSQATYLFRFEAPGGLQRLRGAFTKTMGFHNQDGFYLRTKDDWIPVNLTVSRLHVAPKPLGLIIARDDRERRNALSQARRVESELRTVLANSPAALWSAERGTGPDVMVGWQFRYVSPLLARIAGRPADYFDQPFKWAEAVYHSDRESYQNKLRKLITGSDLDAEWVYRVAAPDGAVRWVRDRLQVVRDSSGRPTRLDGCLADITEQRQADESLRQNEQRFRALVEKSRDGILLLDEKGAIKYASPAVKTISGYEPAALVGTPGLDMIHPDDRAATASILTRMLSRPGEAFPWTGKGLTAGGGVQILETSGCNRLADPSVKAIVINYRDVTEREQALRELSEHHALLNGLFSSVPELLCFKDRSLRFLGGNPAFEALAGQPVAAMVSKTCQDVGFHEEWSERLRLLEPSVIETGNGVRAQEWVTYPDGRKALLDIGISPLRDAAGAIVGLIVVGRDVTEQNRLEEQLRQSQKMEAVGRLAGGIAHDFNNLLTVILGNVELLKAGARGAEAAELIDSTDRAARQAADLTKQMLGFARRQPLRTVTLDLNTLIGDTLSLLRRSIDRRVRVDFCPAADLLPVSADPVQLQQVVMNLCLNARDAMADGGVLTVETANADGLILLRVADTGTGMTEDVRNRIFEPFFTTKDVGQGTGLGLAVVYGVAKAHGGWIECHSEVGRGTRFDVYLPCGSGESAVAVVTSTPAEPGQGETILVADDEPAIRDLARTALERSGYRVLLAASGAEAVEAFQNAADRVKVVVLDSSMPHVNGRQAFERIRAIAAGIPVLFASGNPTEDTIRDESATAVGYLNKPYSPTELAAAVRQLLDGAV